MYRWHKVCFTVLVMALLAGAWNTACAQTVFREIKATNSPAQQHAAVGLLGEFNYCASYEVGNHELDLNTIINGAGGLTPHASGLIRIVRGGRISQEVFFTPGMDLPLLHGDVLIAVKSSANLINVSSNQNQAGSAQSRDLIQIAIMNLRDYPVVFGVPAEIADLAGILRCLRQPVEQYAEISETIRIIPPERRRSQAQLKARKLTTRFESGTVLVLRGSRGFNRSLVPHSLPTPRPLQYQRPAQPDSQPKNPAPASFSTNEARFQNATPVKQEQPRQFQHTTPSEQEDTPAEEASPVKPAPKSLQLNGPLLQQTSATLAEIPNPLINASAEKTADSDTKHKSDSGSTVPDLKLATAPEAPADSTDAYDYDERPKSEGEFEDEEAGFWPPGTGYLLFTVVAFALWKYLRKKPTEKKTATRLFRKKAQETPAKRADLGATIARWNDLPPLPEKSLLEQILEKQIPVIDETPQIPTQTFIYGRHQKKTARVDQQETLKGPHFLKQTEPDSKVSVGQGTSASPTPEPPPRPTEKKLKAPSFRFDRSHENSSKEKGEAPAPPHKTQSESLGHPLAGAEKKHEQSGILDRVLQAVQGVMPK